MITAVMIRRALDIPRPCWSGDAYVLSDVMPMSWKTTPQLHQAIRLLRPRSWRGVSAGCLS